jgi:hypothetical protein
MILPETPRPTPLPPKTISSDDEDERLDRALEDLVENQWVNDFVKRLNYTIEDIVRKK